LNYNIVNSNNKPWTLGEYLGGLSSGLFQLGKRNTNFEQDLRKALPEITKKEVEESRKQLTQMSRFSEISGSGIEATDKISFRGSFHDLSDCKLYLWRGGGRELHQKISEKVNAFNEKHKFESLDYDGGDVHDYGHVLTGFKPTHQGEAQQVVFDIYFQHMLRGYMADETLAFSLQTNFKLAKLASHSMSLLGDLIIMDKERNLLNLQSYDSNAASRNSMINKELKRTDPFYKKVANVSFNKWTFPNGHDMKLVDKSLRDIQNFLKHRESLVYSGKLPLVNDLQKHWLKDTEIEDIANYAQFCALKCMGNLADLSPEEKDKTIQQVMNKNGYFNMELFERSTGLGTDNELKLPTYKEWREMLDKQPEINYNELITKKIQSIKDKR
jgi:hypothetical protein